MFFAILIYSLSHKIQDIVLAKALSALSPSAQQEIDISSSHGVDILFGGHDHFYFVSKGVTSWENYDITKDLLGAKDDNGDVLVLKSGTDFRDLSECTLELDDTPLGSVRRKVIKGITGRLYAPQSPVNRHDHCHIQERDIPFNQALNRRKNSPSSWKSFCLVSLPHSGHQYANQLSSLTYARNTFVQLRSVPYEILFLSSRLTILLFIKVCSGQLVRRCY